MSSTSTRHFPGWDQIFRFEIHGALDHISGFLVQVRQIQRFLWPSRELLRTGILLFTDLLIQG
jgi:hypothetical protein